VAIWTPSTQTRLKYVASIKVNCPMLQYEVTVDSVRLQEKFAAVFDPLDGSSNIDACIPTGTIFGLFPMAGEATYLI
jgi:fructose-1,6-bisphosphatase